MNGKLPFSKYFAIGFMLFALFFGAGNLIFPAQLGQEAGTNLPMAMIGLLITGVGLPLLGVLAMGFSGSRNLQELASRVHPIYGVFFTCLLYLTIGPFFASPRTGTVAYEVGIAPLLSEGMQENGLFIFTLLFFGLTLLFSLNPAKIVDRVGKILAPGIVILLALLTLMVIFKPMASMPEATAGYVEKPFITGFLVGYNTMDALASLVFGIIVITAIREFGVTSKKEILKATAKSGVIAITTLGILYIGVAYMGARSTNAIGLADNGGAVLSSTASYYFGTIGLIFLAILILLACLTTAIGLTIACAEYFQTLLPKVNYKLFVVFFATIAFLFANFGLTNIITYSIPVLMFLYPLAMVLMIITFISPLFYHRQLVYVATIFITFLISIFDGLVELCHSLDIPYYAWMQPVLDLYEKYLPLYDQGLGWIVPVTIVLLITGVISRIAGPKIEKSMSS